MSKNSARWIAMALVVTPTILGVIWANPLAQALASELRQPSDFSPMVVPVLFGIAARRVAIGIGAGVLLAVSWGIALRIQRQT